MQLLSTMKDLGGSGDHQASLPLCNSRNAAVVNLWPAVGLATMLQMGPGGRRCSSAIRMLGRAWQCAQVPSVYLLRKLSFAWARAVTPWKPAIMRINTATQTPTKYLQREQCGSRAQNNALRTKA